MATWNAAFEASPADGDTPGGTTGGASKIRDTRLEVRLRGAKEHTWGGTVAADGLHKAGSAKVYMTTATPTLRPDGSTSLGTDDKGRLWMSQATSTSKIYIYTGSAWTSIGGTGVAFETKTLTSTVTIAAAAPVTRSQSFIVTGFTGTIKAVLGATFDLGPSTTSKSRAVFHYPAGVVQTATSTSLVGTISRFSLGTTSVKVTVVYARTGTNASTGTPFQAGVTVAY